MDVIVTLRFGYASGVFDDIIGREYKTVVVSENDMFGLSALLCDAVRRKISLSTLGDVLALFKKSPPNFA